MTEFFYSIDLEIFRFINQTLSNPIFDKFFPFITDVKHWFIAYLFLWSILFFNGGKKGKITAFAIIILVLVSDQLSSNLLKHYFQRIRPCNALENINLLVGLTHSYSFPSSHAVNNFAVATFLYKLYPKLKWALFAIAGLMAFSRPYVGVHYPSDIFAGAIIGTIVGLIFAYIVKIILNKFNKSETK